MNTITVNASRTYKVYIDDNLLNAVGKYACMISQPGNITIISDSTVWPIYGDLVKNSLLESGFHVFQYVFPAGEPSKNGDTYLSIVNFLSQQQMTRSDILIALGGGVVGDVTGFVAATYLRGIPYIQIPTTLLAMVDSSVGGKTAIDLSAGKNLVGAFYQPSMVLCDICSLQTLPTEVFRDGCAEVIKYAILYDPSLFRHLYTNGIAFDRKKVVSRCVELKRDVVAEDEFDLNARQKLNLGHTIGHSIEASSNYTISHGNAVAIGMSIVSKAGYITGICSQEVYTKVIEILRKFGLPVNTTTSADALYNGALTDKKRTGNFINLIIPQQIGSCIIQSTPISTLKSFIEAGL